MSDVRVTDERLKSFLNSRQADRERMCAAILATEKQFSNIEPRRPEGGPDKARDLQLQWEGQLCYAAVGFKNNCYDSTTQTREVLKKFEEDLESALKETPGLKAFVFMTNIDLKPSDQERMKEFAYSNGILSVDLYWRERIRLSLDSAEGFAIRLQFLDIHLSDAEQKVFFTKFGEKLQGVITGRLDSLEARVEEIQFRNWRREDCRGVHVVIQLHDTCDTRGPEIRPYRMAVRLHEPLTVGKGVMLLACFGEAQGLDPSGLQGDEKSFFYNNCNLFGDNQDSYDWMGSATSIGSCMDRFSFGISLKPGMPIAILARYVIDFYCDQSWAPLIKKTEVWFDDYLVQEFFPDRPKTGISMMGNDGIPYWPMEGAQFKDRPVDFWGGWSLNSKGVCQRHPVERGAF